MHFCLGTASLNISFFSLCPLLVLYSVIGSPQDACRCMNERVLSHVQLFTTPRTVAHQAPLSMEFSRQEYWSGLLFPFPGDLPDPGIEPYLLCLLRLQVESLPQSHLRSPSRCILVPKSIWTQNLVLSTTIGQKTTRKGKEGWKEGAGGRCTGKGPGSAVTCRTEASCHTLLSLPPGWSLESLTGFSSVY